MKLLYVLLSSAFFLPTLSPAQDLAVNTPSEKHPRWNKTTDSSVNRETPSRKTAEWNKEEDQINGRIDKKQLIKMKNVNETMISILRDSIVSEGSNHPIWHGEFFSEKNSPGPILKFGVHCDYSANAHLRIIANDISPLLNHLVVNNTDFLTIQPALAARSTCQYFEYEGAKYWLVTTALDRLPYTPVTRKEYLQEARNELTTEKNRIIADLKQKMPVRSLAVQEAEKTATIDQMKNTYSGIDLQIRMRSFLKNYRTDEDYLKENIDTSTNDLANTLHLMDSLSTSLPAVELGRPALVSVPAADFRGFEDNTDGRSMLVKINPTYIDPNPGVEKPQLFLVSWTGDDAAATADSDLGKQIAAKVDQAVPYLLNILLVTNSSKK